MNTKRKKVLVMCRDKDTKLWNEIYKGIILEETDERCFVLKTSLFNKIIRDMTNNAEWIPKNGYSKRCDILKKED